MKNLNRRSAAFAASGLVALLAAPAAGEFPTVVPVPVASPAATAVPAGPVPRIVFEAREHDFGSVVGEEKAEHVFRFRNEGEGDLRIERVTSTCGCTAALLSSDAIPPGGAGEVRTTFTFGGRKGFQQKAVHVHSNDPAEPRAALTIKGTILPFVDVEPASIALRDDQAPAARRVIITQTLPDPLRIEGVSSKLDLVETSLSEQPPADGRRRYALDITLKPDTAAGRHFETVTVATNLKERPRVEIPVHITVMGDIQASPTRVYLGSLQPGQEVSRQVTLTSATGRPFRVEAVECDNADFGVAPAPPPGPSAAHSFTVRGRPSAQAGGVRAKITFRTDHPKQPEVAVTAYGYIRREAARAAAGEGGAPPAP
ncbi:MAG: DUF1573 domain-containing protein [bacterium]|nr:DUF1573 domain-containing protein [bacterium]